MLQVKQNKKKTKHGDSHLFKRIYETSCIESHRDYVAYHRRNEMKTRLMFALTLPLLTHRGCLHFVWPNWMAITSLGESVIKHHPTWFIVWQKEAWNDDLRRTEPCSRSLAGTCPARVPAVAVSCPDLAYVCDQHLSTWRPLPGKMQRANEGLPVVAFPLESEMARLFPHHVSWAWIQC